MVILRHDVIIYLRNNTFFLNKPSYKQKYNVTVNNKFLSKFVVQAFADTPLDAS